MNDTIAHSHVSSTPTNTQLPTSDSPGPIFLIQAKHDRYPTEERVLGESEWITKKPPTESGSSTDVTACGVEEQSRLVLFMGSDNSDTFSASHNSEFASSSGGRALIVIANEPTDVSPPLKPVGELPADVPKVKELKNIEYTVVIENGGNFARPEDPAVHTTQQSDTRISLHALTTQPLPSIPKVTGQDGCAGQPSEEGAVDRHRELNGGNGHAEGEEESRMEHFEDVEDEVQPVLLLYTSPSPGVKEGSQGTDADAEDSNAYLEPTNQTHPAKRTKKHSSDTGATSVISVCNFRCV